VARQLVEAECQAATQLGRLRSAALLPSCRARHPGGGAWRNRPENRVRSQGTVRRARAARRRQVSRSRAKSHRPRPATARSARQPPAAKSSPAASGCPRQPQKPIAIRRKRSCWGVVNCATQRSSAGPRPARPIHGMPSAISSSRWIHRLPSREAQCLIWPRALTEPGSRGPLGSGETTHRPTAPGGPQP